MQSTRQTQAHTTIREKLRAHAEIAASYRALGEHGPEVRMVAKVEAYADALEAIGGETAHSSQQRAFALASSIAVAQASVAKTRREAQRQRCISEAAQELANLVK